MTPPVNDSHEFIPIPMRGAFVYITNQYAAALIRRSEVQRPLAAAGATGRMMVDPAWSEEPQQAKHKPRLVVFSRSGRQPEQPLCPRAD